MVFCGQCGSPLAPDATRCPNCGAASDVAESTSQDIDETLHIDDPTIESRTLGSAIQGTYSPYPTYPSPSPYVTQQNGTYTPPEQHKLILHANGSSDYDAQLAAEATSAMRPAGYQTYPSPARPASNVSTPPSPYNTVVEQTSYPNAPYTPVQATPNYQSNPGAGSNYASYAQPYSSVAQPGQSLQQPKRRRGFVPVLLVVLLLLVLASGAFVVYALHNAQVANNGSNTGSGSSQSTATPVTPADHARAIVEQYYNDINNKNYHEAYYLWVRDGRGQTYTSFVHGYAHTVHDDLTIHSIVASGSTEKVFMTIVATESRGNTTSQHTYNGYYVVEQVNGVWKIVGGYLY
ncbi:MAG TPA: hypothetical protein DHW02_25280 [Ktedonobacter sp.]|nr:hypothetical protein [Ktedonobacter sp.]